MSGPLDDDKDAKSKMVYFLQKYTGKCMQKGDLVWKTDKGEGGKMTCTVKLMNLEDEPSFEGQLEDSRKTAEQSAAEKVLEHFSEEIEQLKEDPKCFKGQEKRKASVTLQDTPMARLLPKSKRNKTNEEAIRSYFGKCKLLDLLAKHFKRAIGKDDMEFTTEEIVIGKMKSYKATLKLPCLDDKFDGKEWAGKAAHGKADAHHEACEVALVDLIEDEDLKKIWEKGLAQKAQLAKMYHSGFNPFDVNNHEQMWTMLSNRVPVIDELVAGKVTEHKKEKEFGFIMPDVPIDHPMSKKRRGALYFSNKDVIGFGEVEEGQPPEWVEEGTDVVFKVYCDMQGLGASEIKKKPEEAA